MAYTGTPTSAGSRISDANELSTLQETDLARVGKDIYRRDLAKEQEFAKTWEGGRGTDESETAFRTGVYTPPGVDNITDQPTSSQVADVNTDVGLEEPTADVIENAFVDGATASIDSQKNNLFEVYKSQQETATKQMEALQTQIDAMSAKQEEMLKETDPTKQAFYDDTQEIARNQLEAAKTASASQDQLYKDQTKSIGEIESILTSVQANIRAEENRGGLRSIRNARVSQAEEKGIGRVGVLEAVMAARETQLSRADTLIDNAYSAVTAVREDSLAYYKSLQTFYSGKQTGLEDKILDIGKDEKDAVDNQITMIEDELAESEAAKDEIKKIIYDDPSMAEIAGINLTDTVEEIASKVAEYDRVYGGVTEMREDYPDAGIVSTDTTEQANAKLQNSAIYRKKVRIAPTGGGAGTEKLTGMAKALDIAADEIMQMEAAGASSDVSYWNLVNELAEDLNKNPDDIDRMLIQTINQKKGITGFTPETEDNIASDFVEEESPTDVVSDFFITPGTDAPLGVENANSVGEAIGAVLAEFPDAGRQIKAELRKRNINALNETKDFILNIFKGINQ